MFLFTTTRNGIAAKRVERELGVTYKTAWRMCPQVRAYMASLDNDDPLGGPGQTVEVDEALIGGKAHGAGSGRYVGDKALVIGMLENGGELITRIVKDTKSSTLVPVVQEHVLPGSYVHTDSLRTYRPLGNMGYQHSEVCHQFGEYVSKTGATFEGFWSMLRRGINGTHIHVSHRELLSARISGECIRV